MKEQPSTPPSESPVECCERWLAHARRQPQETAAYVLGGLLQDLRRIAESESTRWIPCSERRPEWDPKAEDVLAYTITGHVTVTHPTLIASRWDEAQHHGENCFYTHWKALPKGPSWTSIPRS